MFPILHKVWHSLLSIMKHIKALIIDGSYSIWILTFCFGQPMWRSFCCATLHQKRRKWHTAMVMAIVDCDVTKLSVWLLCVTWPVSFYADPKQCWRWRTREKGFGALQGHLYEGVAWNKNILPMVALDEYIYRDDGLLQNRIVFRSSFE